MFYQCQFIGGPIDGVFMLEPPVGLPGTLVVNDPNTNTWHSYTSEAGGGVVSVAIVRFHEDSEVRLDPYDGPPVLTYLWDGIVPKEEVAEIRKRSCL